MAAFVYRMPNGIPGEVTRKENSIIEPQILGATAFTAYGLFAKLSSSKLVPIGSGDLAADVYGLLIRPYPITGANASDALGTSVPPTSGIGNILKRGYASVLLKSGTAAAKGQVYVRVGNASSGKPIGGVEAAAEKTVAGGTITGTGTGTIAATVTGATPAGTWSLTLQTTSQTSRVTVIDPSGVRRADATVGTAYTTADGLAFTITAAGTMTAGDSFAPVVTANTLAVPECYFMAATDASGNVEISYNI